MGYIKKKIGDISNVPYVTFECDTVADVAAIDVSNVVMGSRCYVVDTGETYALNSNGEWKEVPIGGGVSSWNDLTDKPFYEEVTVNKLIDVTNASFSYDSLWQKYHYTITDQLNVEANKTYIVEWNGVQYRCTAKGSTMAITLGGQDKPFLFRISTDSTTTSYVRDINATSDTTNDFSIYLEEVTLVKLDTKYLPNQKTNLTINLNNKTYTCDIPLPDLFTKIQKEGWGGVNIMLTESNGSPLSYFRAGSYLPYWIKFWYMNVSKIASTSTYTLVVSTVMLDDDGTVTVTGDGKLTGEMLSN